MFFNQFFHGALNKLWKYAYTLGTLQVNTHPNNLNNKKFKKLKMFTP
jgi:hypothetical protein